MATLLDPILNAERIHKAAEGARVEDLGVSAPEPGLLEIRLERPTPHLLELLAHQAALPVHPATADRPGRLAARVADWVSNGPYVLKEFVPSSHIRLDRNPAFHSAAEVRIETVISYPIADAAVAARRFVAGELHLTTDIPTDQIAALRGRLGRTGPRLSGARHLFPAAQHGESPLLRCAAAPGAVARDRPGVHRRARLGRHHAAGLWRDPAPYRQLRRNAPNSTSRPPPRSNARTRRSG